ncbi:MAG: histidine--tRNA ligase [Deltaproteobacteria bacterium]|jgi:histidyl-tRNA synthetase|nr:histidine--tRNA ligase [Deltaproteobacteria bacterium]
MAKISTVKGFADHLPEEALRFAFMEAKAREIFSLYSYREIHIPLLEYTELFARSIGTETDVVQKEMFTFPDRRNRSLTLRPEATAGVMRACMEHGLYAKESQSRLFTFGPMFRYERPQKGRMRQFHQVDCECLGTEEPRADAEIILMLMNYLRALGLEDLTLELNTLGCKRCRPAYRERLKAFLSGLSREDLCEDCRRRLEVNPLRLLDCKNPVCAELTAGAPEISAQVCPDCREHFARTRELLESLGQSHVLNPRLVRGLDYYTRTTFEVLSGNMGASSSLAGGGRYDGLAESIGGPDIPGIGFACGLERLALLLPPRPLPVPDFYIAILEEKAFAPALLLAERLRAEGFSGSFSFSATSLKSGLRSASRQRARYALILGSNELEKGVVLVKNLESGLQKEEILDDFSRLDG